MFNTPPAWLDECVEGLLSVTGIERVILVDDGSEPPVAWAPDRQVVVVRQDNGGPSAARNRGLNLVVAGRLMPEFVLLLDSDDVPIPAGVAAMLDLARRSGAGVVIAAREELDPATGRRRFRPVPQPYADRVLPVPDEVFLPLAIFGASGVLVRSDLIRRGLRFDESLRIGEDRDFLRRAAELAPIAVCAASGLVVRRHAAGLTSPAHLLRRVADHLAIVRRHHCADSDVPLCLQTRWLLNMVARTCPCAEEGWSALADEARRRGWSIPLRARLRRALRVMVRHAAR